MKFTREAKIFLSRQGGESNYGARPLRRAITTMIEDRISDEILKGNFKKKDIVEIRLENDELKFVKSS